MGFPFKKNEAGSFGDDKRSLLENSSDKNP